MNYTIFARLNPKGEARPLEPSTDNSQVREYHRLTVQLSKDCEQTFGSRFTSFTPDWAPKNPVYFPLKSWVSKIDATTADPYLYLEMHAWFRERQNDLIDIQVGGYGPSDPDSIVHARWVSLSFSDVIPSDSDRSTRIPINEYSTACPICRWPNLDSPPNPYRVVREVGDARYAKYDMFGAHNAMFVVSKRVRDVFLSLVGDQIAHGDVIVNERPDLNGKYFWIRPKYFLDTTWGVMEEGQQCPSCGIAERHVFDPDSPSGAFTTDLGQPEWNIARVGKIPWCHLGEIKRWMPRRHEVVVSGGFFAVLYNHNVKKLDWPNFGPLFPVNKNVGVAIEPARRFGDLFKGSRDKIMKHIPDP